MGALTKIEWTATVKPDGTRVKGYTFNIVWGCQKVSPACEHCYAEAFANRLGKKLWGPQAPRQVMGDAYWREPLKWNRKAEAEGIRRRVFCSSMADVFEDHPTVAGERSRLWSLIEQTPMIDWLLLTKRPENIREMLPPDWLRKPRPNVWFGVTAENQAMLEKRAPILASIPAIVRFLSAEPLLGPLDLTQHLDHLDWVIVGGESGPGARLMRREWATGILDQCAAADVPAFFKQKGAMLARAMGCRDKQKGGNLAEFPPEFRVREFPHAA